MLYGSFLYGSTPFSGRFLQKLLSEGVVLTEEQAKAVEKAFAESASISDTFTRQLTIRRWLVESSLFLTDAQGNITSRGVSEQLILNDWLQIREPEQNSDFETE